jgi:hypothetical protein
MKRRRILIGFGATLVAAVLGTTVFAIASDVPTEPPTEPLPPPGTPVEVAGPDGEPIICGNGEPLKVPAPGPPPAIPGDDLDDSTSQIVSGGEEKAAPALVPRCGPNNEPVLVPLSDEASPIHSLGFDGTCDITATVSHTFLYSFITEGWRFDFDATGSCTGRLDDEQIQDAPVTFSMSKEYTCPEAPNYFATYDSVNLSSTLNFSGTYEPGIDAAIRVQVDWVPESSKAAIRGRYSGAAELTGTIQPWIVGPCGEATGTFTGQLQTLQPLQG